MRAWAGGGPRSYGAGLRSRIEDMERQLAQMKVELREEENRRFVTCVFPGCTHEYVYQVEEGSLALRVGDYAEVWAPMSGQFELVKVVRLGRDAWPGDVHALARRHVWRRPITREGWRW